MGSRYGLCGSGAHGGTAGRGGGADTQRAGCTESDHRYAQTERKRDTPVEWEAGDA
jgi:hypothetical protein